MKRLLQLGFILGLAGTLAAAHYVPWPEYARYASDTRVLAGGGRVEQFMIRLPADRIELAAPERAGTPEPDAKASAGAARASDVAAPRVEHFKLRDVKGNVIGIAAKHTTTTDGEIEKAWLLGIPSRGSIVLTAPGEAESIDDMLAAHDFGSNGDDGQDLSIDLGGTARSVATSGEFDGIVFELIETWVITGIDENGEIQGTLRLNTIGRRSS